jgi:hypothetical protein
VVTKKDCVCQSTAKRDLPIGFSQPGIGCLAIRAVMSSSSTAVWRQPSRRSSGNGGAVAAQSSHRPTQQEDASLDYYDRRNGAAE